MKIVISDIKLEDGSIIERVYDDVSDYALTIVHRTDLVDKKNKKLGFKVDSQTTSHCTMYPRDLIKEVRQGLEDLIKSLYDNRPT